MQGLDIGCITARFPTVERDIYCVVDVHGYHGSTES